MTVSAEKVAKQKDLARRFHATKELYWFIIPGIAFYLIFKYYPIYGSQMAFRDYSPFLGFWNSPWVGLANFQRFFASPDFMRIIRNTLMINISALVFGFPFPIALALMLNQLRSARFKKVIQTTTYAPYFISMVVLVGILHTMLSPYSGVVNIIIQKMGGDPVFFMGNVGMFVTS